MTTFIQKIVIDIEDLAKAVVTIIENVAKAEIDALAPIVAAAIPTVVKDAAILGTPAGLWASIWSVGQSILPQLEAAGINAATSTIGQSLTTAIQAGLIAHAASAVVPVQMFAAGPVVGAEPAPDQPATQ